MATWILTGSPENYAAAVRLTGELFEDRTPVWPGKPAKADPYPWRFESEPASQGQLRTISEHDADVLLGAMRARAGAGVG